MNKQKNKGKKNYGAVIAVVVIALLNLAGSMDGDSLAGIIAVIMAVAAIASVLVIVKKSFTKGAGTGSKSVNPAGVKFNASELKAAIKKSPIFAHEDLPEDKVYRPERPTVAAYDETAQERNFIRDRERRIRQLDNFLKNGIIEKEEYLILKARYEKDSK